MQKRNFLLALITQLIFAARVHYADSFHTKLLHWGDLDGQLNGIELKNGFFKELNPCQGAKCIGGLSRLTARLKNESSDGIVISTGNVASGPNSLAPLIRGWREYGNMVITYLKPDLMTLGIKDFSTGLDTLLTYLEPFKNSTTSILLSNIGCQESYNPAQVEFKICQLIEKKRIVETKENNKIGFIGFINQAVEKLGYTGGLKIHDVVESIEKSIMEIKNADSSVKAFIAIGDADYDTCKRIFENLPDVKLVIHSNSLSAPDQIEGAYPKRYKNAYMATTTRYGIELGKVELDIDNTTGAITIQDGSRRLKSDGMIDQNSAAYVFDRYREVDKKQVGKSFPEIPSDINSCWTGECILGNLVTDSLVHCAYSIYPELVEDNQILGLYYGGALGFYPSSGTILTNMDVHRMLPVHNRIFLVQTRGAVLKTLFSRSLMTDSSIGEPAYGVSFLHISSGGKIRYKGKTQPKSLLGLKVKSLKLSEMVDVDDNDLHTLAIPSFIYYGKGPFSGLERHWEASRLIGFDDECLINYVNKMKVVYPMIETRIEIVEESEERAAIFNTNAATLAVVAVLSIAPALLILAGVLAFKCYKARQLSRPLFTNSSQEFLFLDSSA